MFACRHSGYRTRHAELPVRKNIDSPGASRPLKEYWLGALLLVMLKGYFNQKLKAFESILKVKGDDTISRNEKILWAYILWNM